ncbi:MAG: Gfo/Idh/MocA family oxidoreductase [Pseudomonadota bacterium]|nr:Gfo/Idh/MocA family oxidoreductase [Pseudomonadota bacterium]
MKATIIGGGFGLYGYLPALLQTSPADVLLPVRYRERLLARNDIHHLADRIIWLGDTESILPECSAVIIALPPALQAPWIEKCLEYPDIQYMLLEKPLAVSPAIADSLLKQLEASGKIFRIGYNFRFTDWGSQLLGRSGGADVMEWCFQAHHYARNVPTWKRLHAEGGGALRFYGIHLIALLAELGYTSADFSHIPAGSPGEAASWTARITGAGLVPCSIHVDSHSQNTVFTIRDSDQNILHLSQPFEQATRDNNILDQRVVFLKKLLDDLFLDPRPCHPWYERVIRLWNDIEQKTSVF